MLRRAPGTKLASSCLLHVHEKGSYNPRVVALTDRSYLDDRRLGYRGADDLVYALCGPGQLGGVWDHRSTVVVFADPLKQGAAVVGHGGHVDGKILLPALGREGRLGVEGGALGQAPGLDGRQDLLFGLGYPHRLSLPQLRQAGLQEGLEVPPVVRNLQVQKLVDGHLGPERGRFSEKVDDSQPALSHLVREETHNGFQTSS
jgi:hypothetical protein